MFKEATLQESLVAYRLLQVKSLANESTMEADRASDSILYTTEQDQHDVFGGRGCVLEVQPHYQSGDLTVPFGHHGWGFATWDVKMVFE